ncbi:hypothetical protein CQA53_03030 [Helicobacter didelphidarum]|uniref:Uncharacterized protein n=1 Tax=Helicobacter didelphidarum TaxID=2040648 RepID=A0A3D8INB4_9HELI|nr:hypothetical protein [Helicobacter didelphidarum]RDU66758.1 hypothetical protein CQA53_03030 [Helicobacter didelphidarum]
MRLDKVLDILFGNLTNTPYISSFESITSNISKVKQGTLFFLQNPDDLQQAIQQGAYGIVFDIEMGILDSEIAWIKVENISQSIMRLVRYLVLESQCILCLLTPVEIALAKSINTPFRIIDGEKITDMLADIFLAYTEQLRQPLVHQVFLTSIRDLERLDVVKICSPFYVRDMEYRKYDFIHNPFIRIIPKQANVKFKILSYNILETRVSLHSASYLIGLPYIFLPFLESLISVLESYQESWQTISQDYIIKNSKIITNTQNTFKNTNKHSHALRHKKIKEELENSLFTHEHSLTYSYNIKNGRFKYFESLIDYDKRFSLKSETKTILFCCNPHIFYFHLVCEHDFIYTNEIKKNMQNIFHILQTQQDSNIFVEYFKTYGNHLQVLTCYNKKFKFGKNSPKYICMPYANISHLSQMLIKLCYHFAIVYGISKESFLKATIKQKELKHKIIKNPK